MGRPGARRPGRRGTNPLGGYRNDALRVLGVPKDKRNRARFGFANRAAEKEFLAILEEGKRRGHMTKELKARLKHLLSSGQVRIKY